MDKRFYEDTYLRTLECTVVQVTHTDKATEVLTDRTIFYPESGGQPGDMGTLGSFKVLDTRKDQDGNSVLILEKDCPVQEGKQYIQSLDWDHRYNFMVMHSAQHMLSGLLFTMYKIGTVAVHQGDEYLTIETDKSEIDEGIIDGLIREANTKISEDHAVIYHEMSHSDAEALGLRRSIKVEGDVRIVEIEGVDRIACGGVHVRHTGEIRMVYCIGQEQIRGHVRLYFRCGNQAVEESLQNNRIINALSRELSCRSDELEGKITALQNDLSESKSKSISALKKLAEYAIKENLKDGVCVIAGEGTDIQAIVHASNDYADLALFGADTRSGRWVMVLKGCFERLDFNKDIRPLLSIVSAKGGGRSPVFQGAADLADKEALNRFTRDFRKACLSL